MRDELPEGWEWNKLLELAENNKDMIVGGPFGSNLKVKDYQEKGVPIIRLQNINYRQFIDKDIKFITPEKANELCYHSFKKGDIVLAKLGDPIGKSCIIPDYLDYGIVVSDVVRIRINNTIANSKYLIYFLNSSHSLQQLNRQVFGTTRPRVNLQEIRTLKIPFPPLETQKKIVAILEKAEQIQRLQAEVDKHFDDLIKSIFIDMFGNPVTNPKGWEMKQLNEIAEIVMGQSPSGDSYNNHEKGVPLLNGPVEFGEKYPSVIQWTTDPKRICKVGSILFCVRGATAGKMNWADKEYCIGRGLASISSIGKLPNVYIYSILKSQYDYFQSIGRGSTFINIGKDDLNKIKIPIPDELKIHDYINIISKLDKVLEQNKNSAQLYDNQFNSLIQKAFKGELVK